MGATSTSPVTSWCAILGRREDAHPTARRAASTPRGPAAAADRSPSRRRRATGSAEPRVVIGRDCTRYVVPAFDRPLDVLRLPRSAPRPRSPSRASATASSSLSTRPSASSPSRSTRCDRAVGAADQLVGLATDPHVERSGARPWPTRRCRARPGRTRPPRRGRTRLRSRSGRGRPSTGRQQNSTPDRSASTIRCTTTAMPARRRGPGSLGR